MINIKAILDSQAVNKAETQLSNSATHSTVAHIGEATSKNLIPILKEVETRLAKIVKKFEQIEPRTEADCKNYDRQMGAPKQQAPEPQPTVQETPAKGV